MPGSRRGSMRPSKADKGGFGQPLHLILQSLSMMYAGSVDGSYAEERGAVRNCAVDNLYARRIYITHGNRY